MCGRDTSTIVAPASAQPGEPLLPQRLDLRRHAVLSDTRPARRCANLSRHAGTRQQNPAPAAPRSCCHADQSLNMERRRMAQSLHRPVRTVPDGQANSQTPPRPTGCTFHTSVSCRQYRRTKLAAVSSRPCRCPWHPWPTVRQRPRPTRLEDPPGTQNSIRIILARPGIDHGPRTRRSCLTSPWRTHQDWSYPKTLPHPPAI